MAEDERAWARQHPEPQVTRSEDRLVLWNYPVGKADLLSPHEAALRQFTFVDSLGPEVSTAEFSVRGHASRTGEGLFDNLALSRRRAEGVGKILRRIGFRFVNVSAAGTAEPADAADAGQSFARNRRVEVTKFIPPVKVKPLPRAPGAAPPSTPPAQRPSSESGIGAIIPELKLKLITFEGQIAGYVDFEATIEATFKGKVRGPNGGLLDVAAVWDGKNLTPRFESKLAEHIKQKLAFEPPGDGKPAVIKFGIEKQLQAVPLKVEVGVQTKPKFFYVSTTFVNLELSPITLGAAEVTFALTGKLKIDMAPAPGAVVRFARTAMGAGEAAAAVDAAEVTVSTAAVFTGAAALGGIAAATAAVMAGLPYMTEEVAKATRTYYLMLSERDGAASQAALETLGADARNDYKEFLLARRGQEFQDAFTTGAGYVTKHLKKLTPEDADALRKAWAATYAKGASGSNFKVVEGAFVLKLGGLDREPADVRAAVDQL